MPQTDYAALAEQARQQAPPQVDYAALAEQARNAPAATGPAPKWNEPGGDVMLDMARGMLKQPGRLVQMIPGVTRATDALYGLNKGGSEASMQPENDTEKVGGYIADALETLASFGAATPKLPVTKATTAIGRSIEDQGLKISTTVDKLTRSGRKSGGVWGYVFRGHPLQGIYAGIARAGGRLSAKTVEGVGRLISSDPDTAARLAVIGEQATTGAAKLTPAQGNFILSAMDHLESGRMLSGAQRAWIASIFRSLPK